MPQVIRSFIYVVVLFQILLNITFINSAVIRREPRSIISNGTLSGISDKELDPTSVIGLEDDENLLLESPSVKDDTTTKNSLQDIITTSEFAEEKKEYTTLTGLRLEENTDGFSSDNRQESSNIVIQNKSENESTTVKNEEYTTVEREGKPTMARLKETTMITPVIENYGTTDKEVEEEEVSTTLFEASTQLEAEFANKTKDDTRKEDKIGAKIENFVDSTHIVSTSLDETANVSESNTTTVNDMTSTTEVDAAIAIEYDSEKQTTHSAKEETDSATKITDSAIITTDSEEKTTNYTVENIDKVTEALNLKQNLIDTATELSSNDILRTFVTNEHKANMMYENELTTETVLFVKDQSVEKQKLLDDNFTESPVTTQLLTSTEFSEEYATKMILEDLKKTGNDTKASNSSSTEKRGKFIAHNYSSFNEFHLPNTSDVWALASLRSVGKSKSSELQNSVETSEEKPVNNSMVTKNLHDWTRVMDTTHDMDSEPSVVKTIETSENPSTEFVTSITTTTHGRQSDTTLETHDIVTDLTTEMFIPEETTILNEENEVELSTTKVETGPTTVMPISLMDKIEREIVSNPTEYQNIYNSSETTTGKYEKHHETSTYGNPPKDADEIISTTVSSLTGLSNHEKTIEENKVDGDSFEKETISFPRTTTTPTTVTPISQMVTMKSETTDLLVNGEIAREANAGTTSLSTTALSDFTTSMPFLTSAATIPNTTMVVMTDVMTTTPPPPVILNTDYEVNESQSTISSKISTQTTSPVAVTTDSSAATTTTTTTTIMTIKPAVAVMAATTETSHTPPIISNETMIQKSNNNNYNEYEVVNNSTENYADNSSTEAFEATTRVGLQPYWSTNAAEISTTDVDKLDDDLDITTESNFENNSAYDTTVIGTVTLAPKTYPIATDTTTTTGAKTSTENLDHIDHIHKISDTAETSIESNVIDPLQVGETSTAAATTTTTSTTKTAPTTESNQENMKMHSTERGDIDSFYSISTTTTTTSTPNYDESATTFESISTKKEDVYSIVPAIDNGGRFHVPKLVLDDTTTLMPQGVLDVGNGIVGGGGLQPMDSPEAQETDVNVIIAISVSTVGIIALILLVAFLYVMRKRQKQMSYGQRCRPVSLDAYSLDNVSVYNSVRRKGATLRASKRSYGNVAFDDPSLRHNVLGTHELARYVEKKSSIWEEFKEVPQIIARADEVPAGCEEKNRYANVIPLPETRVILQQQNGDEKSEYINANYVRGPKDTTNYYIACQAPLEATVNDFWRMIWEQNSRVIIMATDLIENGIDKCSEYLPPSVTLDNHTVFGDYQVTLKHREVKEKYAISTLMLKNASNDESREITHYWYQWPETGVPTDEAAIIAMLLEARSSLKAYTIEQSDIKIESSTMEDNSSAKIEINGNATSEKIKSPTKDQGPLTIHCSPGTGRTGTILACDIAMRCLEEPKRTVDIPQIVYSVRRGRASAVQTKEQYEFIYKVTHMYATKISNINNDN